MAIKKSYLMIFIIFFIFLLYLFYPKNDEEIIKDNLLLLGKTITKNNGEKTLLLVSKLRNLDNVLYLKCNINIATYHFQGSLSKHEIESKILVIQKLFKSFEVEFYDITFEELNDFNATFITTVKIKCTGGDSSVFNVPVELIISVTKENGKWKFCRFKENVFLEK